MTEPVQPLLQSRVGTVAWVMAFFAAVMMLGTLLAGGYLSIFVWKWMTMRNAVLPIMVGSYVVPTPEAKMQLHQEIQQSSSLILCQVLALLIAVAANLLSQVGKRMKGCNPARAKGADQLSTWTVLGWLVTTVVIVFI